MQQRECTISVHLLIAVAQAELKSRPRGCEIKQRRSLIKQLMNLIV